MMIPTEPIGSIPRPRELISAISAFAAGRIAWTELAARRDGTILGMKMRTLDDQGAYVAINEPHVGGMRRPGLGFRRYRHPPMMRRRAQACTRTGDWSRSPSSR